VPFAALLLGSLAAPAWAEPAPPAAPSTASQTATPIVKNVKKGKKATTTGHEVLFRYVEEKPKASIEERLGGHVDTAGTMQEIRIRETTIEGQPRATLTFGTPAVERAPSESAARFEADTTPQSDAVLELVHRQMRKNQAEIDACVGVATGLRPGTKGSLTLNVQVVDRKVVTMTVSNDTVHDPALAECLVQSGPRWRFSLGRASFAWPIDIK
jgi:hypothetical protein